MFKSIGVQYKIYQCDLGDVSEKVVTDLKADSKQNTFPNVYVGGVHTQGCSETIALKNNGKLQTLLKEKGIAFKA